MLEQEGLKKKSLKPLDLIQNIPHPLILLLNRLLSGGTSLARMPVAVSTMPVLLGCSYISDTVVRIYLLRFTSVLVLPICLNNPTKMPSRVKLSRLIAAPMRILQDFGTVMTNKTRIVYAGRDTLYVYRLAPFCGKANYKLKSPFQRWEAEYVALSTLCRDLFSLIDITNELCTALQVKMHPESQMHIEIHEDNVGALTLGKLEPRRMTPRSKHYAVKYHWFREHIGSRNNQLVKISSSNQLGDLFTKGLSRVLFQGLRKQLLG